MAGSEEPDAIKSIVFVLFHFFSRFIRSFLVWYISPVAQEQFWIKFVLFRTADSFGALHFFCSCVVYGEFNRS